MTCNERGSALVIALMMVTLLAALALSLALSAMTEAKISVSYLAGVEALYSADAAVERVTGDLLAIPDWNRVLDGTVASDVTDGPPGVRQLPDGSSLDLTQVRVADVGPWGANNPRWQLFASAWLSAMLPAGSETPRAYVAVWVGDDAAETDGNPLLDSNETILLLAHAYGRGGVRRAIEATISRARAPASEGGAPIGVRLLSWREVH